MRRGRFLAEARNEFLAEVAWYEKTQSGLGGRFRRAVEESTFIAAAFPSAGSPCAAETRRVMVKGFPFSIVYRSEGPSAKSELAAHESRRDLAAELLQSVREMKAGQVNVVSSPVIEARRNTGLSQSRFAALIGVSVRTLQGWEQGRKQPSGAALTLLAIASTNPKALLAVVGK